MKRWMQGRVGVGLAMLLSAGVVWPAAAQFPGGGAGLFGSPGSGFGSNRHGGLRQSAREKLQQLEAELALMQDNIKTARARYEAGQGNISELRAAELELLRAQGQIAEARLEANREKRLDELNRFVDIDLQGATVRQAAQALSKASGMPVHVDEKVTDAARITVRGRGVPVAVLLDRLGSRANLMISPSDDGQGVELQTWPALELDGERTVYKGPLAPWSTEWGSIPISGAYQATSDSLGGAGNDPSIPGMPGGTPGGGSSPSKTPGGSMFGGEGYSGMPGMPGMPGMMGMPGRGMSSGMGTTRGSSTSLGTSTSIGVGNGSIVVAEPGFKDGHAGLWLTVYKLSGTALLKIGTGFHRSGGTSAPGGKSGRSGRSGIPGMGAPPSGAPGADAGGAGFGGFGGENAFGSFGVEEGAGGSPQAPMNAVPPPDGAIGLPGPLGSLPGAAPATVPGGGIPGAPGAFPGAPPTPAGGVGRPRPTRPAQKATPRPTSKATSAPRAGAPARPAPSAPRQ